jgi:hypothetical protein
MSHSAAASLAFLALLAAAPTPPVGTSPPLACDLHALSPAGRDRHERLGRLLASAAASKRELPNGWEIVLDLSKLPADAAGQPFCVAEVAEWVDLESRCCPFLDFSIAVSGREKTVRLALTGTAPGIKEFLAEEIRMLQGGA